MRLAVRLAWLISMSVVATAGCKGNPFAPKTPDDKKTAAWQQSQDQQPYQAQLSELNRRAVQLDANNRDLTTQFSVAQQQANIFKDQVAALQKQLNDTAKQLQETQIAKQEAEKKIDTIQASVQKRGGAIITANNSIKQSLKMIEIPGVDVRQEDDVIRIELPSDQLFQPGGVQLSPAAYQLLDQVAAAISTNYPRQRIGIEGHIDAAPGVAGPASSSHQITAAQANVVFEQLTSRNRLPTAQLFSVAHGANHPRFANVTPAGRTKNRRIELVIYPETFDVR